MYAEVKNFSISGKALFPGPELIELQFPMTVL